MNEFQKQVVAIRGEIGWWWATRGVYIACPLLGVLVGYFLFVVL
jgi:hypothetical protein